MPSTPSSRNRLNKQGTGDNVGSWGTVLNAQVFDLVDEALDGITTITVTGNLTLSSANYATDQARKRILKLVGTPAGSFTLTIPGVEKFYIVHNQTAFAQTVKAGGLGVSVPPNTMVTVYCDGTDTFSPTIGLTAPVGTFVDYGGTVAPTGWLLCFGQAVSRATYSALFAVIGTIGGAGNGSTTFNIPDLRGRASFGKDDMGGTAASRITAAISGITGTTLGGVGGSQSLQSHTHTATVTDPTHNHSHTEAAHNHTHTDPSHNHTHTEAAHTHSVSDPTHTHGYTEPNSGSGHRHNYNEPATQVVCQTAGTGASAYTSFNAGAATSFIQTGITINAAFTGISLVANTTGVINNAAFTGVTNNPATTGIINNPVATGISVANAATGVGASQNVPPGMMLNKIVYAGV